MALPTITFNNATGSDTQASGSGGTAVFGTGAATTAAANTVDLSADAPNLSGVLTDGSVCLWVDASSGREFSKITGVDNGTKIVTCEDTFTNTEGSRTWAIGGKRKTIDNASSRAIFAGAKGGWTIVAEDDQSISTTAITESATSNTTDGALIFRGSTNNPRPIITQTSNVAHFSNSSNSTAIVFQSLEFRNSNGTKTAANVWTSTSTAVVQYVDCIVGHATNSVRTAFNNTTNAGTCLVLNSLIRNCTSDGIVGTGSAAVVQVENSVITACAGAGINKGVSTGALTVRYCLIYGNTGDGIACGTVVPVLITNSTIHGNGGDGIDVSTSAGTSLRGYIIANNNITGNTGYGIRAATLADAYKLWVDYNNFGTGGTANGSGATLNLTLGANDLQVDPGYVNAASGNFAVTGAV